ncbi:MAG: BLUF domain-containing protein, partial [Myxococcota bacterium]
SRRIGGGTRFVIRLPAVPAPQRLRRISYLSEATQPLSPEALSQLLRVARARNEAAGLSGVLMHSRSRFFQVLEGPHDALHATMERIYRDRRHKNVELILDVEVEHPGYQGWALQFTRIDDDLIERIRHGGPSALEDILPARR